MAKGTRKAVAPLVALALAGFGVAGCGSGDEIPKPKPTPPLSSATADQLAELSEKVATDLDAGETCTAASDADELKQAVASADLAASLRPGVKQVTDDLVNEVNCPPPPAPEPKKKPKEEKDHGDKSDSGGIQIPISPGHGGEPPGHAKIHGEPG